MKSLIHKNTLHITQLRFPEKAKMRAYHWTILLWATLFPATQATKQSIGYELLSQYFAYKMEARTVGAGNTKLAPGCSTKKDGPMCTFLEFVVHVSRNVAWDYPYIDSAPGGPDTTDPDVKRVGGNFQQYVQPANSYDSVNINGKTFHADFERDPAKATFKNRFDRVLRSIQTARAGATPISRDDPDFDKCRDAAEWAQSHRKFDISHHLARALQGIGSVDLDLKDGGKFRTQVKVETDTISQDGRTYTYLDVGKTIRASGATTAAKEEAFREMMRDVKQGVLPNRTMPRDLEKLPTHVKTLEMLNNHVTAMQNC